MSIFLSPGVYSTEKDISNIVAGIATSSAGLVGYSAKGSVDEIKLMTNTQQFINEYGQPDPTTGHYYHYAALAYLAKGNTLYCLRVANGALYGGVNIMKSDSVEDNAALLDGKSSKTFVADSGFAADEVLQIVGANPGVWNNRIAVTITSVKTGTDEVPTDQYTFNINVFWQDADGNWSQVETFKVSRKHKFDGYGKQLYLEDVINGVSDYIWVLDSDLVDTVLPKAQAVSLVFEQGSDGSAISDSEILAGWDEFVNPDKIDIRLLIAGGEASTAVMTKLKVIAEARADCLALLDMTWSSLNSTSDMVTFRNNSGLNSSYCAMFGGWCRIYDQYNDRIIDVPPSGYVAAQAAYNDFVGKPWTAFAGENRGLLDVIGIASPNGLLVFSEGDRDVLYPAGINPLQILDGGAGFAIWGNKTLQKKASALDRINVRRLLIVIEKSMAISLRSFLFEGNDDITRFRIEALLNSYLGDLSAQGAFQTEGNDEGFEVVCDTTNNTDVVIDRNQLAVDVFVKPIKTAEFIKLQTIVTTTGASFEELIQRGVNR